MLVKYYQLNLTFPNKFYPAFTYPQKLKGGVSALSSYQAKGPYQNISCQVIQTLEA